MSEPEQPVSGDIKQRAANAGVWYGAISLTTQIVSWAFTFWVVRLLDPRDYGLMSMASILTAYLQMFGGLGIGAAIVRWENISPRAISSVFWFVLAVGVALGGIAMLLAHPTAWVFKDDRLIPVTQLIGPLFVVSALSVVPNSLLVRDLELRKVASVNLVAILVSSILSVLMARAGWGVYTLIWTNIILNFTKTVLFFIVCKWRPSLHFDMTEVAPYLRYGLYVASSGTLQRLFQTLDKLIVGRFFGASRLGIYENAMVIASMPLDKIWPIYQPICFPLFSRLHTQAADCYSTYLNLMRPFLIIVTPIYLGAAIAAPELIGAILGEKWLPLIPWFRCFCVVKLCETLLSYHSNFFNATGRHREVTRFHLIALIVVVGSILPAAYYSFEAVLIPWLTLYPALSLGWIAWGLRRNALSIGSYALAVWDGIKASLLMSIALIVLRSTGIHEWYPGILVRLAILVAFGTLFFALFLLVFQRPLVNEALKVLTGREAAPIA